MSDSEKSDGQLQPLDVSGGSKYTPPEAGIGERIKEKRKSFDLSVEELAALTAEYDIERAGQSEGGVSVPTIYRYEKGDRLPGAREIRLLCQALRVSPNWLVLGDAIEREVKADTEIATVVRELYSLLRSEPAVGGNGWPSIEHKLRLDFVKNKRATDLSK